MVIVHLDGRYFTNIADLMKITIHYGDESIFFTFMDINTELIARLARFSCRKYFAEFGFGQNVFYFAALC